MGARRTLLAAALLTLVAGCTQANASQAQVWVEVSPSTVTAGSLVAIRADCADNREATPVTSRAFGTVTMQPKNSLLQTEVRVPTTTAPGQYEVRVQCPSGQSATATLSVVAEQADRPTVGPHTGGGYLGDRSPGSGGI